MVQEDTAKQMGFKEAKMHEKLRNTLRKRGKHSDEIAEKVKKLMNMDDWIKRSTQNLVVPEEFLLKR